MLLNLDQFGAASGFGAQPKYWAVAIFLVSLTLAIPDLRWKELVDSPLTWWTLFYVVISSLWAMGAKDQVSMVSGLTMVITTALYVFAALLVYPSVSRDSLAWGLTVWLALLFSLGGVYLEALSPGSFFLPSGYQGIVGRASGFYMNPNIAAQSILMIFGCILLRSSRGTSLMTALAILPALVLTFSRAGLVAWAALVMFGAARGQLPRITLAAILAAVTAVAVAGPTMLATLAVRFAPENSGSLSRMAWFLGQGTLADGAATERKWVAEYAWSEFAASPFFGHGLGAMWSWNAGTGTHNMILRHLVEYGAIGLLVFPLFLICSVWSAKTDEIRKQLWPVAGVVVILGLFTHNMLEQACFVFPWLASCLIKSPLTGMPLKPHPAGVSWA